ncbi:hypothetical protein A9Q84_21200 [Halobacteriovorax marinus]|uniref:DNA repair protein RecN n=1 Tax=Halobacteriovorax marinus TaxID=97084 RepID=A0A1Y5F808_9BACT|nr:hypothetical protein A9Q84_21200 [Halobacteriovorax marinus]
MNKDKLILKTLTLNNFATFVNQEIDFGEKFSVIVGETGSGKSLILDALQLIFGHRADKKIIRKGADFSTVEAVFRCNDSTIRKYFDELGHPFSEDEIIIKRIITAEGSSKSYLNFQQCSLSTLNTIAKRHIDLVGQFDNQKLLSDDYQLKLLNDYGKLGELVNSYQKEFKNLKQLENKITEVVNKSRTLSQRKDYLEFQINEMEKLSPNVVDEDKLIHRKNELLNFQRKLESYTEVNHLLSDSQNSILSQMNRLLSKAESNDLLVEEDYSKFLESKEHLEDLSFKISKKLNPNEDESELQTIIESLDSYQKLKRKFSCDTIELEELYKGFKDEYSQIEDSNNQLVDLKNLLNSSREICWTKAHELHLLREKFAKKLSTQLSKKVKELRMEGATLKVNVLECEELNKDGISKISFQAETNSGEGFFKVKDIASGGELSRILLSLRQILSQGDTVSVFLFDEIDTGIGGETAISIGKALTEVALNSQVIAITHLPQIAKFSDHLIDVSKKQEKSRTFSFTSLIDNANKGKYIRDMAQL